MSNRVKGFSIAQSIILFTIGIVVFSLSTVTIIESVAFSNSTYEIVESSSKEINKQIIMNYENYIDSVINTANYIQEKTVEFGLKNRTNQLNEIYLNATEVQEDIVSIILVNLSGEIIASSTDSPITEDSITQKNWYVDAIQEPTIYHFSSPHNQDVLQASTEEVITVTKVVDYYNNGTKFSGVLIVDINTSTLVELSNKTNLGENGHIVILNSDKSLIYSSLDTCSATDCTSSTIMKEIIIGGKLVQVEDVSMYVNVNTLSDTRWRIGTFINVELITATRSRTIIISFIIFSVTLFITIMVSTYFSKRISNPITKLQKHMKLVEKGNLYKQINIEGQKEIVGLGDSFNRMQEEIRALMETVLIEQKEKRKTEFIALQSQINPHFLYNTLDSIVYLSEKGMNEKVQEMVVALSKFFRISISRGKNIITVKEELEHARNYLLIQQIRYNDKFSFEFDTSVETLDLKIVKLVLQPLIENAIYHGINTEYDQGNIIIRTFIKNDKLVIEIEDDGYGITDEKIKEMYDSIKLDNKHTSIGLKNVYQRLKIYYGDETDFIISSELDEKTIIRLIIPIERAK